jgi:outer membrane protein assembly factor BamB
MPSGRKTSNVHEFVVLSLNRTDGKILWQRTVTEEVPEEATHEFGSWASNSALTDGEHIYAYFGSRGLFCLDMQGNLKWERDFGQMSKHMEFGEGESPTLYGDRLIVNWDHEGDSFIAALDKRTGKDIWRVDRDEKTSWSTPYVVEVNGKSQVVSAATGRIRSYDLETGELIWECGGLTSNVIPAPFVTDGILIVTSGFRGSALLAIRLDKAEGDITGSDAIVWELDKDTPYTPSPLLMDENLYFLRSNNGVLSCFDAKTGKEYYRGERLEGAGSIFASPVGADGRIYFAAQQGKSFVVKHGTEFEILAENSLDDNFIASPVILGKQLFLRGYKSLYCIEE